MAKKKAKPLSQAEIWDDSALLQSWDDALAEYQMYHSIQARGEDIEEAIAAVQLARVDTIASATAVNGKVETTAKDDTDLEDGELPDDEDPSQKAAGVAVDDVEDSNPAPAHPTPAVDPSSAPAPASMPAAVLSSSQGDAMKNLLMSWYYAGYYTGYYEGQQGTQQTGPG